jgi:hypothetical protein
MPSMHLATDRGMNDGLNGLLRKGRTRFSRWLEYPRGPIWR